MESVVSTEKRPSPDNLGRCYSLLKYYGPTEQDVQDVELYIRRVAMNFKHPEDVEWAAKNAVLIDLMKGRLSCLGCESPEVCAERIRLSGWLRRNSQELYYIPPSIYNDVEALVEARQVKCSRPCSLRNVVN